MYSLQRQGIILLKKGTVLLLIVRSSTNNIGADGILRRKKVEKETTHAATTETMLDVCHNQLTTLSQPLISKIALLLREDASRIPPD